MLFLCKNHICVIHMIKVLKLHNFKTLIWCYFYVNSKKYFILGHVCLLAGRNFKIDGHSTFLTFPSATFNQLLIRFLYFGRKPEKYLIWLTTGMKITFQIIFPFKLKYCCFIYNEGNLGKSHWLKSYIL